MLLWTPAEARRYFESKGREAPDPEAVGRRSLSDEAPPINKTGPRKAKQELCLSCCCPCCDMAITAWLDKRAARNAELNGGAGGSPATLEMRR